MHNTKMDKDKKNRVLMEACVGFFNSMNLCYKQHDKEMRQMRMRFYNRLESRIRANLRIHQMNLMNVIEMLYLSEITKPIRKKTVRAVWMKKRTADWWNTISTMDDDILWAQTFRMDKATFLYICESLENEFKPKPNAIRESVPIKIKIAAAIYKLVSNESYKSIGQKFGIHGISVQKAFFQFCESCTKLLYREYISMPEGEEIFDIMQQFEDKVALPQLLGVMEAARISISLKAFGFRRHMVNKGTSDIILQAIIDPNCLFRDVGFLEDSEDFLDYNSRIKHKMLSMPLKDIDEVPVPAYLVSRRTDTAQWWLMKPYANVTTPEQELFNDFLSKSLVVAENTFMKLKGRWTILQEPMNMSVSFIPKIVLTCCILHNILETKGLEYDCSLNEGLDYNDILYSGPVDDGEESCPTGEAIRDHLTNFTCSQLAENRD